MGQISAKLRRGAQRDETGAVVKTYLTFWCPGCEEVHMISVNPGWTWDGNAEAPTFSPSIKVTDGHYATGWVGPKCWCTYKVEHPDCEFACGCCHSYVVAGRIQFLDDCTHALKGQTVDLPDLPEHLRDGWTPSSATD